MFITVLFSLLFYNSLFSYNPDNPEIPFIPEEPEKPLYNPQHTDDIYREFGIGQYGNRRKWLNLNWVSKDSALFERHRECKNWSQKEYVVAIIHQCCNEVSFRDDDSASLNGYNLFYSDGRRHFYLHRNDEDQILNQADLYEYQEFRNMASFLAGYKNKIRQLYSLIQSNQNVRNQLRQNAIRAIEQQYEAVQQQEAAREKAIRDWQEQEARIEQQEVAAKRLREEQEAFRKLGAKRTEIRNTFNDHLAVIKSESQSWNDLSDITREYSLSYEHLDKRNSALEAMNNVGAVYTQSNYELSTPIGGIISEFNYNPNTFTTNYGNQLQQVVHTECIDILGRTAQLNLDDCLYGYRGDFVDCIDASREFNQLGLTHKSTAINDFCWTMLDIGQAMGKGACLGVYYAAYDLATHPFQTGLCLLAGQYVLAYQACKIAYAVADIAITSCYDKRTAYEKLDSYLAPVDALLTQFEKGVSAAQIAGTATQVAVGYYAQGRMLKGLNSIYSKARVKAVDFIKRYPQAEPELFLTTPEGMLLKSSVNEGGHHFPQPNSGAGTSKPNFLEEALNRIDVNKIRHIFNKSEHNLAPLVKKLGGNENVIKEVLLALEGKIPQSGLFKEIPVSVGGYIVHVRGMVIDGIPRIGTLFIKPENV